MDREFFMENRKVNRKRSAKIWTENFLWKTEKPFTI